MLKVWNVSLVLATGVLAILGTFLVRSGILNSIHAFGASTLGIPFLVLIGVLVAGSVALVVSRASELRSEHRLDSLLSREAVFLLNNLVLVGLCFVIFWGTFFPLISEALTGNEASVGPPWFDRYIVPLSLVLVLLSGIGPVIAWRRATAANLRRNLVAAGGRGGGDGRRAAARGRDRLGERAADVRARGVRGRGAWGRSCGAACGRGGRCPMTRCRGRSSRSSSATAAATAATSCTSACRCCSRAWRRPRRSRTRATSSSGVGQTARVGGYDVTYVKPTGDLRGGEQRAAGEDRPRRGDAGLARRRDGRDAAHRALVLPLRRPVARAGVALLRGRGDERGRPARGAAPRRLERDLAERARPAQADRGGRQGVHGRQGPAAGAARGGARAGARRADALLRREPAARDVPADRLAAGELDLDRRADRVRGRPDRAVAARRARAPRPVAARYAARVAQELGRA